MAKFQISINLWGQQQQRKLNSSMDKLFQTFWEVKGFNRFFDVPKQKTQAERHKLLKEVFEDMAISGGKLEGNILAHFPYF